MLTRSFKLLLVFILPLFIAACGGGADEITAEELARLPTLAASATASNTPSDTPVPSLTPLPTSTPSTTPSSTPTATFTATVTASPTNIPSSTPAPTLTLTFTPVASAQALSSATPNQPFITSFTSSTTTVNGGGSIVLSWTASGDTARIEQLNSQNALVQTFSVQPSGQLTVTAPSAGPQVTYRLILTRAGQEASQSLTIIVQTVCTVQWFFQNPPSDVGCPAAAQITVNGKLQQFQNGIMINLTLNGENRVYGFNDLDLRYTVYPSQWDGVSSYSGGSCGSPPLGLQEPQDVFNWAYYNTLGTFGQWCTPQTGIGWAISPYNPSINFTVQNAQTGTTFFIDIPGYGVVGLTGESPLGSWRRVP